MLIGTTIGASLRLVNLMRQSRNLFMRRTAIYAGVGINKNELGFAFHL